MSLIRTPRLTGRPVTAADAPFMAALFGAPEVARWAGESRAPWSGDEAARRAAAFAGHWAAHDFGLRVWEADGAPAALAGLQFCVIAGRGEVEASFAVAPAHWGRGFGLEAMRGALAEAPEICRELAAVTWSDNAAALGVLKRLGFAPAGRAPRRSAPARRLFRLRLGP